MSNWAARYLIKRATRSEEQSIREYNRYVRKMNRPENLARINAELEALAAAEGKPLASIRGDALLKLLQQAQENTGLTP